MQQIHRCTINAGEIELPVVGINCETCGNETQPQYSNSFQQTRSNNRVWAIVNLHNLPIQLCEYCGSTWLPEEVTDKLCPLVEKAFEALFSDQLAISQTVSPGDVRHIRLLEQP